MTTPEQKLVVQLNRNWAESNRLKAADLKIKREQHAMMKRLEKALLKMLTPTTLPFLVPRKRGHRG